MIIVYEVNWIVSLLIFVVLGDVNNYSIMDILLLICDNLV